MFKFPKNFIISLAFAAFAAAFVFIFPPALHLIIALATKLAASSAFTAFGASALTAAWTTLAIAATTSIYVFGVVASATVDRLLSWGSQKLFGGKADTKDLLSIDTPNKQATTENDDTAHNKETAAENDDTTHNKETAAGPTDDQASAARLTRTPPRRSPTFFATTDQTTLTTPKDSNRNESSQQEDSSAIMAHH